ncbi:MAG: GGDEF domain-containing protein [Chloroflexi bacterium]|nr:MAG: GGDEF domain-containing protein [Chloroflexota bacterium]
MASGQHPSIPHQASLKPREISYRESLVRVTHIGAITGGIFIFCFMVLYWALDYPRILVFISLAALLMDLVGLGLVSYFHIHKPAAHLVTLALYSALLGSALYTGGIDASSLVWLMFVPIAATIMAGTTDGIVWSAISLSSVLGVYLLNRSLAIDLTLLPSQSVDRLIDLSTVALASGIAIAINERTKARAMDRLENAQAMLTHLATVDPLTNVFNRRYFFDRAQIELEMDRLRKSRTSIILLDIDHFKKINDSYGHNVGDQILIGIVAICQENLRETDTLARLGGEEFVILLPNTDLAEARHLAERLRKKLEDTPIKTEAGPLHATVSLGVTSHPTSGAMLPVQKLVQGADQAMYLAKRAGRNRVATWQDQEPQQHRVD